jgi:1-acyl-sn-glycerol-3-phosphate acyltransferase
MDIWYALAKDIVRFYKALFIHPQVKGKENIPGGPKIIVGNHSLASDPFVLPFIFREKLHFLIERELFNLWLIGKLLALADQIPVVNGRGREAIRAACQRLDAGESVVIFPEGRLNHGERMYRAGAGAALIASQTGVPIVPVAFYTPPQFVRMIRSRMENRATLGGWQFGGPLFVNIGQPIRAMQTSSEYLALRQFTDQVMGSLSLLINEMKVDQLPLPEVQET